MTINIRFLKVDQEKRFFPFSIRKKYMSDLIWSHYDKNQLNVKQMKSKRYILLNLSRWEYYIL
jgi:hypothetical protein